MGLVIETGAIVRHRPVAVGNFVAFHPLLLNSEGQLLGRVMGDAFAVAAAQDDLIAVGVIDFAGPLLDPDLGLTVAIELGLDLLMSGLAR